MSAWLAGIAAGMAWLAWVQPKRERIYPPNLLVSRRSSWDPAVTSGRNKILNNEQVYGLIGENLSGLALSESSKSGIAKFWDTLINPVKPEKDSPLGGRQKENHKNIDLGQIITEVATRLRSGLPVEDAWRHSLRRWGLIDPRQENLINESICDDHGVPRVFYLLTPSTIRGYWQRWFLKQQGIWCPPLVDNLTLHALPGAIAACRLTHEVGAPLADVLDACARGITEATEAQAARDVALAGPATSARTLQFLPLFGLLICYLLNVNPLQVLGDGRWGSLCALIGLGFLIAGKIWTKKLITKAEQAGG